MTVAAIDRLVHHAMIIEIEAQAGSYRKKQAINRHPHLSSQGQITNKEDDKEKGSL